MNILSKIKAMLVSAMADNAPSISAIKRSLPTRFSSGKATRNQTYCRCCKGHLSMRDAYCRNRGCGLFMAEEEDVRKYSYWEDNFGTHVAKEYSLQLAENRKAEAR